jgi:DUF4097 and DUF4098 domain-containing protein YvlB
MTEHHFETIRPVELYVEIGKGSVQVSAADTTESRVEVTGRDADRVRVEQDDTRLSVVAPQARGGFLSGDSRLDVRVVVPLDSSLAVRTGSADIDVDGAVATAQLRSGSGGIRLGTLNGPGLVETGSGDVHVEAAAGELRVKSGSGDVTVDHSEGALSVSTGSGDVAIGTAAGPSVVKTGSGDLSVAESLTDVTLATGSGDLVISAARRGRVSAKGASGDVRVGVPAGLPVWTDVSTVSGSIRSDVEGAGEPQAGQDHLEVRARTVSGDVLLTRV